MVFDAKVLRVLIASPSDVQNERRALPQAIHRWNSTHAQAEGVILLPTMWETDAVPEMGGRPQGFINDQLVRNADIIIGTFWTKVGSPTGVEDSGTIEEIKEGSAAGKKVMLYFSLRPWPPRQINRDQHQKLEVFKEWCRNEALYFEYKSVSALSQLVDQHLSKVVQEIKSEWQHTGGPPTPSTAQPPESEPDDRPDTPRPAEANEGPIRQDLLRSAAESEFIRQRAGIGPLDTGLMRRELGKKACLNLTAVGGFQTSRDEIQVPFRIVNDGRHPAFDIHISVSNAGETIFFTHPQSPIRRLNASAESQMFSLRVPRSPRLDNPEHERWTFEILIKYKDALGEHQNKHVLRMEGVDPNFKVWEDTSEADFHPLCAYTRPSP